MTNNLDTLATALYVRTDDLLKESPQRAPWRPGAGICPQLSDAELVILALMQALPGFASEARWVRYARAHLRHLFPYLPQQPGYKEQLDLERHGGHTPEGVTTRILQRILALTMAIWHNDMTGQPVIP